MRTAPSDVKGVRIKMLPSQFDSRRREVNPCLAKTDSHQNNVNISLFGFPSRPQ